MVSEYYDNPQPNQDCTQSICISAKTVIARWKLVIQFSEGSIIEDRPLNWGGVTQVVCWVCQ